MPDGAGSPASATDGHTFYHVSKLVNSTEDHYIMSSVVSDNSFREHATSTWIGKSGLLKPWCKSCQQSGHHSQLKLFQFNFEDALYMCTEENCQFPMSENNVEAYMVKRSLQQLFSTSKRKRKKSYNLQTGVKSKRLKQQFESLDFNSISDLNDKGLVNPQISTTRHPLPNLDFVTFNKVLSSPAPVVNDESCNWQSSENQNLASSLSSINAHKTKRIEVTSIPETLDSSLNDDASQSSVSDNTVCSLPCESRHSPKDSVSNSSKEFNVEKENISPRAATDTSVHSDPTDFGSLISEMQTGKDNSLSASVVSSNSSGCQTDSEAVITMIPEHPEKHDGHELSSVPRNAKMIQWKNENNLCWLDAILLCTVNNCCVREALNCHLRCGTRHKNIFYRLCKTYDDCQAECNEILLKKRVEKKSVALLKADIIAKLHSIRLDVFNLLQTRLSLEIGKDESIVELLPNFLGLDPVVQDMFSVQLRWELTCEECNYRKVRRLTTSVVSFPSTCCDFHPLNAAFSRQCFSCSAKDQRMNMTMEVVPPCLVMHFQTGLSHNRLRTLDFSIQEHLYCVTAVIQYVTNPFHHFIVWIRDSRANKWMCCDDLKNPICTWKSHAPKMSPKQIHMVIWEKQNLVSQNRYEDTEDIRRKHLRFVTNQEALSSGDEDFPAEVNNENSDIETIVLDEVSDSRNQYDDKASTEKTDHTPVPKLQVPLKSSKTDNEFRKLPGASGRTSAKLISCANLHEPVKPKRNYKLAGYKKAKFRQSNVFAKPYEKTSPTANPVEKLSSYGSSEKLSDISDLSDLFSADLNCYSNYSDGSVTTASQNSDPRSFGDDFKRFVDVQFSQLNSTPPESSDGDNSIPFVALMPNINKQIKSLTESGSLPPTLTPTSTDLEDMLDGLDFDYELSKTIENYPNSSASSSSNTTSLPISLPALDVTEDPFNFEI